MLNNTLNKTSASKEELMNLMAECYGNYELSGKVYFPDRFTRPFDQIHHQIFDALKSDAQKIAIAAPRGIGKTSINNLLFPAMKILYADARYIVPVSATSSSAVTQSENLKKKLMNSDLIRQMFGEIKTKNFSKEQWVVNIGGVDICIMPRGGGQQVRGILYEDSRPDLIIVDDLEKSEEVRTEEQRAKVKEWFYADLLNCVDRGSKDWKIIFLGTVLHEDSLLLELKNNAGWEYIGLEICDDEFHSNAPNFMSDEEIRDLYEEYASVGQTDVFYREYRNMPISAENAPFKRHMFKYYNEAELYTSDKSLETFLILDPARTSGKKAADSACVAVSYNNMTGAIYVRDIISGKFHPDEFLTLAADCAERLGANVVGIEVTGLHEYVMYPIKNIFAKRNLPVEFVELHARGGVNEAGKTERVRSLVPFYRQGLVYHNQSACQRLEQQLLSFPASKLWDIMDALGYTSEMLERGLRYAEPFAGEYETLDDIESEYDILYEEGYEDPIEDFRLI